ncbi:MAG: threonine synthase [Rhodospirillaceae bacterium]|nr:threonine synthase [Rhodospirillaceae bacterium]
MTEFRYISTRGRAPALGFADVLLAGLARDGGLYVPDRWPHWSADDLRAMAGCTYAELAARVMAPFVGDAIAEADLAAMAEAAYAGFDTPEVAPLVRLGAEEYLLELFHGPTFAFKDFALQLVGLLFDHVLRKRGERITILGATSGDTGSAAIAALAGRASLDVFILHPKGRVSDIQRLQMTTVDAPNVHNIAVEGTFDDCQDLVKAAFNDLALRDALKLSAVNSINWARVAAQIVYYVWAALKLGAPARAVSFAVPTGNFGNVYAGYGAKQMGLPVAQLVIGSNRNDILTRFFEQRAMEMRAVEPSHSPSMDIQVSSNFERLLFDLLDRNGEAVAQTMAEFRRAGLMPIAEPAWQRAREIFDAARFGDDETLAWIRRIHGETGHIVDPHSAIGIAAGRVKRRDPTIPMVALATAHPAKFPAAVRQAIGREADLPPALAALAQRPEHCTTLPNDAAALFDFLRAHAGRPRPARAAV